METNFIGIDFETAISMKKEILKTEINVLYAKEKLKKLLTLKKREKIHKKKIQEDMEFVKNKIKSIRLILSKTKTIPAEKNNIKLALEEELLKIKQDLEKLEKDQK